VSDRERDNEKQSTPAKAQGVEESERDFALRQYRMVCRLKAELEKRYQFNKAQA
jgi:hypothetical protein